MTRFSSTTDYRDWVDSQIWYQTITLSHGITTRGSVPTHERLPLLDRLDVRGKRVLDIGCNSGQYALWAKSRGAGEVIGIDVDPTRLAQARTLAANEGLDVEFRELSLLDAPALGTFDLVLAFAVVTEITDLWGALRSVRDLTGGQAVLEVDLARPLLGRLSRPGAWLRGRHLAELRVTKRGDWVVSPSLRGLRAMLGPEFEVERNGKGIRYDLVTVRRRVPA